MFKTLSAVPRFLLGKNASRQMNYDNVTDTTKRKVRAVSVKSEDDELTPSYRRRMLSNSRDLMRNYAAAVWAVGTHTNSVSSLKFHSRNGIKSLDARITALMKWWSRPANCHSAGQHSLATMIRMIESRAVVDGDIFLLKLQTGHLQPLESDRIASVSPTKQGTDISNYIHGVQVNDGGRRLNYCVCKRENNTLKFERLVPAWQVFNHGYYDRFDQVRGITPLSAALNAYQDTAEGAGYALLKCKFNQQIALAIYREIADSISEEQTEDDKYSELDLSDGRPIILQLDPGDRAEWLESKSPAPEFQSFFQESLGLAFKTLHIPHCFYWGGSNYAESKLKRDLWFQFIQARRDELRTLLNAITAWRIGLWIQDGYLTIPHGWRVSDLDFEWVGAPLPSINILQDIRGQVEKINAGLTSKQRAIKELSGDDPEIIKAENEAWEKDTSNSDESNVETEDK